MLLFEKKEINKYNDEVPIKTKKYAVYIKNKKYTISFTQFFCQK